jgi:hypothetical protein
MRVSRVPHGRPGQAVWVVFDTAADALNDLAAAVGGHDLDERRAAGSGLVLAPVA